MNKPATPSQIRTAAASANTFATPDYGHSAAAAPSHEEIARRAFDIYVKSGRKPGQCTRNWHQAEQSLRDKHQAAGR